MLMKRWMTAGILMALVLFLAWNGIAKEAEKFDALPELLKISVLSQDRTIGNNEAHVHKETLETVSPVVNRELQAIADGYEAQREPTLQPDSRYKKGSRNSRLDIDMVYYRTGDRYLSVMALARVMYYREQRSLDMTTRTYDLATGQRILLADLFTENSPAWELLVTGLRQHMVTIYPGEKRSMEAVEALCQWENLQQADFTLSGMELTLHYHLGGLFEGKNSLTHVRFYYPQFDGMMTELGAKATDNSRWKMVAITCDDGPKDYTSTYALNALRKVGARVTYFVVGKQLERYGDVFQRQYDQNHTFGSHTNHHWSGYSIPNLTKRLAEADISPLTLPLVGERPQLFRPPGGTYPPWVEIDLPMPIMMWGLDTYDYTGKSAKRIFYSIRNNIKENDMVLCHDTGKYMHEAVPIFGEYLVNNGYMMVTVEELAVAQGVELENTVVYYSIQKGR